MIKKMFSLLSLATTFFITSAEELHINVKTGNDTNPGTQLAPLKTLQEAAKRINANNDKDATTIFIAAGVYPLTETVLFNNNKFTLQSRLIIRAEILPDDVSWNPQCMPIIITVVPTLPGVDGDEARGLQIDASHVSVEGLRFSGSPDYSYMDGKKLRRSYPIWRNGKNLDDLLVSQCLFSGDADVLPLHAGVIANGHGLVLDHCVFINCKNSVIFWEADGGTSYHNAMRYCLVYGCYKSGVWTTETAGEDFEFHHNIIANCQTAWIMENKSKRHYRAHDCIFTGNSNMMEEFGKTNSNKEATGALLNMENVRTVGSIEIEKDQSKNSYLQLKAESLGSELKAGLFKK